MPHSLRAVDQAESTADPAAEDRAAAAEVGVGPWQGGWPTDERYDRDLLRDGDRRNVVDRYRYWRREAIVADLDTRRHPFHVAIENFAHDFNIGSVVRTANAFAAAEVHIVGRRRWNRRGAMVTDRYQHVRHHATVDGLAAFAVAEDLPILGIDNVAGAVPLETYALPERCLMLFGQEGPGLSEAAADLSTVVLSIAQFGSTRSINAGAAAAVAMHAWVRRHRFGQTATSTVGPSSHEDERGYDVRLESTHGGATQVTHDGTGDNVHEQRTDERIDDRREPDG